LISYEPLFRTLKEKNISSYRLEKMGFARNEGWEERFDKHH